MGVTCGSQGVALQGGEAMGLRLGANASQPQADLDGFKSRLLQAGAPSPRHLYAIEWRALGVMEAGEVDAEDMTPMVELVVEETES